MDLRFEINQARERRETMSRLNALIARVRATLKL
jgi:hypothetical protein